MHNFVVRLRHVKLFIIKRLVNIDCSRQEYFVVDSRRENNGELLQQFASFYGISKTRQTQPRRHTVKMYASAAKK